jgi:hypothetical protein
MTPAGEHAARLRGHELAILQWHWDDFYDIGVDPGEGCVWRATRRDGHGEVHCRTPEDLRDAIVEDYLHMPVRVPRPDDAG